MEWLRASREPLRSLPYAMMDKRLIRWVPSRSTVWGQLVGTGPWEDALGIWGPGPVAPSAGHGWGWGVAEGHPIAPHPGRCVSPRAWRQHSGSSGSKGSRPLDSV